ncbi:hypothetical protein IP70_18800 [alpha proteobacterium AAP38]|nr:hypothetical protein IP70_18800 [alpha proteobacterium AAP38]
MSAREQDRLRRRDSLPVLPDSYEPLLRAAGLRSTLAFIRHYGGGEARFPARPGPDHPMVRLLGRRVVAAMRAEYGALDLHWPAASDYLALVDARALRQKGWTVRDIARRLYRDPKTIERYVKGVRAVGVRGAGVQRRGKAGKPAPLPLFSWGG